MIQKITLDTRTQVVPPKAARGRCAIRCCGSAFTCLSMLSCVRCELAAVQMIQDGLKRSCPDCIPSRLPRLATLQVATIKWWLRQAWDDSRLRWDPDKYAYSSGNGTATVDSITRPPGSLGGVWIPDMVRWPVGGSRRTREENTPPKPQAHSMAY